MLTVLSWRLPFHTALRSTLPPAQQPLLLMCSFPKWGLRYAIGPTGSQTSFRDTRDQGYVE
jgi:hypothetical protein